MRVMSQRGADHDPARSSVKAHSVSDAQSKARQMPWRQRCAMAIVTTLGLALLPLASVEAATCPGPAVGGRAIGSVTVGEVTMPIKPVTYPSGGDLLGPNTARAAGVSTRHQPLTARTGTSLVVWHYTFGKKCPSPLNVLTELKVGEEFEIFDGKSTRTYRLTERHRVRFGDYRPEWFRLSGPRQVVLVTCTGLVNGRYTRNLIHVAVPSQQGSVTGNG
jgi:hypothetical protein